MLPGNSKLFKDILELMGTLDITNLSLMNENNCFSPVASKFCKLWKTFGSKAISVLLITVKFPRRKGFEEKLLDNVSTSFSKSLIKAFVSS